MTEISTLSPSSPERDKHHAPTILPHPVSLSDSQSHSQMSPSVLCGGYAGVMSPVLQAEVSVTLAASLEGERQLPAHISTSAGVANVDSTPTVLSGARHDDRLAAENMFPLSPVAGQGSLGGGAAKPPTSAEVQKENGQEDQGMEVKDSVPAQSNFIPNTSDMALNQTRSPVVHSELPCLPPAPTSLPFVTFISSHGTQTVTGSATKHVSTLLEITITGNVTTAAKPQQPQDPAQHKPPLEATSPKKIGFPSTPTAGRHTPAPPEATFPKKLGSPSTPRAVRFPPVPDLQEPALSLVLQNPHQEPASDTLSYLESASLMSGTLESLSGLGEEGSSLGSDSEVNGLVFRRTDKYGFLGGTQYSEGSGREIRADVARQREMKWLEMISNWDKWIYQRFQKVKMRCRKGIPSSLRAKAWQLLSNSKELMDANPGKFEALEREQGDPKWLDTIEKDLHRQFPFHEMFAARGGHGQQDLYRILKAYTVYRPEEGYCQAQAPVAAVLLMHMPAEQAFWCLVQICEVYLPGYYSAGLEAIQLDGDTFFSLLRRLCPMAYRHLKKYKIDPILYMTEWFMCIFSRSLPWACVLRVWDMFFCEGVKIVFRVGLVLLKQMLGSVEKLRELQGMYETMERLRSVSQENIREDLLVQEVISLPVTEALIERECNIQVSKWRESRGELSYNPGRRLHGARAIYELKRRTAFPYRRSSFSFLGGSAPSPGPLRASSSLLSLPGFRKSKGSLQFHVKKGSDLEPAAGAVFPRQSSAQWLSPSCPPSQGELPRSSSTANRPLDLANVVSKCPSQEPVGTAACSGSPASAPSHALPPSPKIVTEVASPSASSPVASGASRPPAVSGQGETAGEEGKKKRKSKEEKKKEKEEERQRGREQKEKGRAEKVRQKKEKERAEKERKKDRGGT